MVYLARDNRNSFDSRIAVSSFQASLIGGLQSCKSEVYLDEVT